MISTRRSSCRTWAALALSLAVATVSCSDERGPSPELQQEPAVLVTSGVETGDDGGLNDATLGVGRLVVAGSCVAFKVDSSGDLFTVVWGGGTASWVNGDIAVSTFGEVKQVSLGQRLELRGSEIPAGLDISYRVPPSEDCPAARFGAGDVSEVTN